MRDILIPTGDVTRVDHCMETVDLAFFDAELHDAHLAYIMLPKRKYDIIQSLK